MLYRAILSRWEIESAGYSETSKPRALGDFELATEEIKGLNEIGYNIYFFPNRPSKPTTSFIEAADVDIFQYVFVDMDLKDKVYATKDIFINKINEFALKPCRIVDSGNGVHVYWPIEDLDPMSYLRLQRRLCRHFNTDPAVSKLNQLMRVPGTHNTKTPDRTSWKLCQTIFTIPVEPYQAEQLSKLLEPITKADEDYCVRSYDAAYNPGKIDSVIEDLPKRWFSFAKKGDEAYRLFYGENKDRSKADYRLAHLMAADGFTREEALAVLANSSKASERSSAHRYSYASNIIEKMWETKELIKSEVMGHTVEDLLKNDNDDEFEGTPFRCHEYFDATTCGFRLTHVLGLVGGAGSGKTAVSLNYFYHFAKKNCEYSHVVFTLEQPGKEIAKRWKKIVGKNPEINRRVYVVDNYTDDGQFRNLSLDDCEEYVKGLQASGVKIGCVMIDHIGILKKENKNGEREGLIDICCRMKAFAVNRNIMLIMQSQTNRDKAKGGDVELDKDAAYGTTNFEWFVDWLVTIWQPLKRVYKDAPNMTVTCFKYCKIRHKHPKDNILEDVIYALKFDPETGVLRRLNLLEKEAFDYYARAATAARNRDKNKDPGAVSDITWETPENEFT